eukprot:TRINITY_DN5153_c0_g1_i5.p1 TRINITY_DN5153_c0_g1~~TRINITY_DN5153_c0_g1_i5.p1  ORF type:complete len:121 (+),score=5.70 TRINITY_DN5153_c0_g1_i5:36-398(+)
MVDETNIMARRRQRKQARTAAPPLHYQLTRPVAVAVACAAAVRLAPETHAPQRVDSLRRSHQGHGKHLSSRRRPPLVITRAGRLPPLSVQRVCERVCVCREACASVRSAPTYPELTVIQS